MALVTLEDVKEQINVTTTEFDAEIQIYADAATGAVERHLNKVVVPRSITEEHYLGTYRQGYGMNWGYVDSYRYGAQSYSYGRQINLNGTPVQSLTSVARVDGTLTWDITSLHADPSGTVTVLWGPQLSGQVTVTYMAGMDIIPPEYKLAGRIIAQHLWMTQRGSQGSVRASSDAMRDSTMMSRGLMGFSIPNRALELLGHGSPGFA